MRISNHLNKIGEQVGSHQHAITFLVQQPELEKQISVVDKLLELPFWDNNQTKALYSAKAYFQKTLQVESIMIGEQI